MDKSYPTCGARDCIAPNEQEIQWDITPDMLMATAERHWERCQMELALKELEAEYFGRKGLSVKQASRAFK